MPTQTALRFHASGSLQPVIGIYSCLRMHAVFFTQSRGPEIEVTNLLVSVTIANPENTLTKPTTQAALLRQASTEGLNGPPERVFS